MPTVLCEKCHEVAQYLGQGRWKCTNGHIFKLITVLSAKKEGKPRGAGLDSCPLCPHSEGR